MRQFLSRVFADLSEFLTFITTNPLAIGNPRGHRSAEIRRSVPECQWPDWNFLTTLTEFGIGVRSVLIMIPPTTTSKPIHNNLKGILWMFAYAALVSSMHGSIRYVSADMHPFEIAFFRNLFGLIAVAPWFIRLGWAPLRTNRLGLLIGRGALNTVCMLAFFTALSTTPLTEVTALSFIAPVFAAVLAIFVFGDRIGFRRWAAILVGFVGVFVVLRPGFTEIGTGQILVLVAALGWGVCLIIIKALGRTESSVTITTYMSLVMAPLSLIPAMFFWTWPSWEQLAWLAMLGTLGGFGQMAMAEAYRVADTHVLTPIDFTRLLFVAVIGYLAFGEVPDIFVWIGGAMIFSATAFIAYREHRLRVERRN